jgi:hypothetical protein
MSQSTHRVAMATLCRLFRHEYLGNFLIQTAFRRAGDN